MGQFDKESLSKIVDGIPFARTCGITVAAFNDEASTLTLSMSASDAVARMNGSDQIHGGAVAALIDTAGTILAVVKTGQGVPTINLRTDFLKPAAGNLIAQASIRRVGRKVSVVDVDVTSEDGTLIAIGRGTFGGSGG